MFNLETDRIVDWVRDGGFSSVALQLPEGLKANATTLADELRRRTGAEIYILGHPCYGACDLFISFRKYAEALVHFGHSPIPALGHDNNVLYIEAHASIDIVPKLTAVMDRIPDRVGLLATVQYVGMLPIAETVLRGAGKEVSIGKGDSRICHAGQVLGCNCSAASSVETQVDGFLFIGEGDFHPLAAAFGMKKDMLVLNPVTGELRSVNDVRDRILRKRFAIIESARNAKSFIILVSGKIGQERFSIANDICTRLRDAGRSAEIVIMEEINPDTLAAFRADAFVNTACPRIAMDDSARYRSPMLTVTEVEHVLGNRCWDDYAFDVF